MRFFSNIISIFLLSITLISCGGKKNNTKATFKFSTAFLSSVANSDGGVMFYGQNLDTRQFISYMINDSNNGMELVLDNGAWDFAAVAWDGDADLNSIVDVGEPRVGSGKMKCSVIRKNLGGGDDSIVMSFSIPNCMDPIFGDPTWYFDATTGVKSTYVRSCLELKNYMSCTNSVGTHYRARVFQFDVNGGKKLAYETHCQAVGSASESRSPLITMESPSHKIAIDFYTDQSNGGTSCDTFEKTVALKGSGRINEGSNFLLYGAAGPVYFDLEVPVCETFKGMNDANAGVYGPNQIVCTPGQLATISPGSDVALGRDIDFDGVPAFTNNMTVNSLDKNFNGRGHTIRNLEINVTGTETNIGIFPNIGSAGSTMVMKNVTFENITIDGETADINDAGIIAGKSTDVRFKDVEIVTASVSAGSGSINIGGAVGTMSYKTNNTAYENSLEVRESSLKIVDGDTAGTVAGLISIGDGSNSRNNISVFGFNSIRNEILSERSQVIGGAFGKVSFNAQTANSRLEDIFVDSFDLIQFNTNLTLVAQIGGAFGEIDSPAPLQISKVGNVLVKNTRIGQQGKPILMPTQVGGIVGRLKKIKLDKVKFSGELHLDSDGGSVGSGVGGIIGVALSEGFVKNFISDFDIFSDANNVGGVLGFSGVSTGVFGIGNGRVNGHIGDDSQYGCANNCAGVVGGSFSYVGDVMVSDTYAKVDIKSSGTKVGGVYGYARQAKLDGVAFEGVIDASAGSGGVVGEDAQPNGHVNKDILVKAILKGSSGLVGSYAQNVTGGGVTAENLYLFTQRDSGGTLHDDMVFEASVGDPGNSLTNCRTLNSAGGTVEGCEQHTEVEMESGGMRANFPDDFLSPWIDLEPGVGGIQMSFKRYEFLNDIGGFTTTGIEEDPFIITTTDQWNNIGDNPGLMEASFMLGANLNFSSDPFNPIGSKNHHFKGSLRGNNHTISNIDLNETATTTQNLGLFRVLGAGARINPGTRLNDEVEKLYLHNVKFTSAGMSLGTVAGIAFDSAQDPIVIDNIRITSNLPTNLYAETTTGTVGGVVGQAYFVNQESHMINIKTSDLQIGNQSGSSVVSIGGIVGDLDILGGGNQGLHDWVFDGDINAEDAQHVGGAIGNFESNNQTHVLQKIATSGSIYKGTLNAGGVIGYAGNRIEMVNIKSSVKMHDDGSANIGCLIGQSGGTSSKISHSISLCGDPDGIVTPFYDSYAGNWNASTNLTPTLTSTVTAIDATDVPPGTFLQVTAAGGQTLNGNSTWTFGDLVVSTGNDWERISFGPTVTKRAVVGRDTTGIDYAYLGNNFFIGNVEEQIPSAASPSALVRLLPDEVYDSAIVNALGPDWMIEDGYEPRLFIEDQN